MSQSKEGKAKASASFDAGLYCAESVLSVVAENQDITSDLIPRIATGFCSGLSRTCGTCGALTGGVLGINLAFGRDTAEESVERNYAAVHRFVRQFEREFGSVNCRDVTTKFAGGVYYDINVPWQKELLEESGVFKKCSGLVGRTAARAAEMLWE